jgi:hypothetical protein
LQPLWTALGHDSAAISPTFFPLSLRRLRRSGDGYAVTQQRRIGLLADSIDPLRLELLVRLSDSVK